MYNFAKSLANLLYQPLSLLDTELELLVVAFGYFAFVFILFWWTVKNAHIEKKWLLLSPIPFFLWVYMLTNMANSGVGNLYIEGLGVSSMYLLFGLLSFSFSLFGEVIARYILSTIFFVSIMIVLFSRIFIPFIGE